MNGTRRIVILLPLLGAACASVFETPEAGPPSVSRETLAQQWFEIANLYAELGELEDAEAAYRQSLALGMDQRARHNLGLVQVRMGMQSLASAREGLPADPANQANTRAYLQRLLDQVGAPVGPQASVNPHP